MRFRFLWAFLICSALAAQTFTPRTVLFTGAPAYTQAELLKLSGLTPGQPMTQASVEAALHKLDDTGLFSNINYKLDGGALRIELEPMAKEQSRAVVYTNFVLDTPAELTAGVHEKLSLFNGSVPVNGEMQAGVERALEALLEDKHQVHATVTSLGSNHGTLDYTIMSPPVLVGKVVVVGVDLEADKKLQAVRDRVQGSEYSQQFSGDALNKNLTDAYQDLGYVDFKMSAVTHGAPAVTAKAITVDLLATGEPGALYRAARVDLPAGQPGVGAEQLEHAASLNAGAPASRIERLSTEAGIETAFQDAGYLDAKTTVSESKDATAHTVAYAFQTTPGVRYRMRNFMAKDFSPDRAQALAAAWKLAPGAVYDGAAAAEFARSPAARSACPRSLERALVPDRTTHQVDVIVRCKG